MASVICKSVNLVLMLCVLFERSNGQYCRPGEPCWPTRDDLVRLDSRLLRGERAIPVPAPPPQPGSTPGPTPPPRLPKKLVLPIERDMRHYQQLIIMKNINEIRWPAMIILPYRLPDVQEAVKFARRHKMRISVLSSGHDYIGRSTFNDSVQIDMRFMQGSTIRPLPARPGRPPQAELIAQSGNMWSRIIAMVNQSRHDVVSTDAFTVSVAGWTMGGGHSPVSRTMGLGVDNVLSFTMVRADGRLAQIMPNQVTTYNFDGSTVNDTTQPNLFWALRGGGGGTFGIVTRIHYIIYPQPAARVLHLICTYPIMAGNQPVGAQIIAAFAQQFPNMPRGWGGSFTTDSGNTTNTTGFLRFNLIHYGQATPRTPSIIDLMKSFTSSINVNGVPLDQYAPWANCQNGSYGHLADYVAQSPRLGLQEPVVVRTHMVNVLLGQLQFAQPNTINTILNFLRPAPGQQTKFVVRCKWSLLGGAISDVPTGQQSASSVNDALRTASVSLSCNSIWKEPIHAAEATAVVSRMGQYLKSVSPYSYVNMPERNVQNWKQRYWGSQYQRLEQLKMKYDPENYLTCAVCVGADLPRDFTALGQGSRTGGTTPRPGWPTNPAVGHTVPGGALPTPGTRFSPTTRVWPSEPGATPEPGATLKPGEILKPGPDVTTPSAASFTSICWFLSVLSVLLSTIL